MAVHRISDAAEAALHRVCTDGKMGDFISRLIIEYERGLSFDPPDTNPSPEPCPAGSEGSKGAGAKL